MQIQLSSLAANQPQIVDSVFHYSNIVAAKPRRESHDVEMKPHDFKLKDHDIRSHDVAKAGRKDSANSADLHFSCQDLSTQDGSPIKSGEGQASYSQVMFDRWHRHNALSVPMLDQKDIVEENPLFNHGARSSPQHQAQPEFTQSSYLRLRATEEAFAMKNYMPPAQAAQKPSLSQRIQNSFSKSSSEILNHHDRSFGIQKLFDLHVKKEYKPETLFTAAAIFDRYIAHVGVEHFPRSEIVSLAAISMLMAAKLEQPISPSFLRMINLLTDDERRVVSKSGLIALEEKILIAFNFDFNFPGPIQSLERYLRLLDYDLNKIIFDIAFQVSKFSLNDARFLDFPPSKVAASSLILAVNIFEWDAHKNRRVSKNFFQGCRVRKGKIALNLDIWNREQVRKLSGYSLEDIKECLYELSKFIWNCLSPNRLENFDIEAIRDAKNYDRM